MSQYSTGTATLTNNNATVTGTNTLWLANVTAGDSFTVAGDGVMYDVASVDSDTQITLSVAYAGVTASGVVYAIGTGFTVPDSFPEMSQGDIETATIFTRAMRGIQGRFTGIETNTTNEIGQAVNDHVALPDPHTQYLKESEYEAHRSREDLLKQATLSLDFANNKYEVYEGVVDGMTQMPFNTALDFTRASSATARTATGNIQEVLTDEQRLVGNRKGLLIEEQRTNLFKYSSDFSNPIWSETPFGSRPTVESNVVAAPDKTLTGDKLIFVDVGASQSRLAQTGPVTVGESLTFSVFVKKSSTDIVSVYLGYGSKINVQGGMDFSTGLPTKPASTVEYFGDGWYRLTTTGVASGDGTTYFGFIQNSPNGEGVYAWGAQLEQGSFPTSYIPTAGAQVTRAADDCVRVLGDEFNAKSGTISGEVTQIATPDIFAAIFQIRLLNLDDKNIRLRYLPGSGGTKELQAQFGDLVVSTTDITDGDTVKFALTYEDGRLAVAINGVVYVGTGTTPTDTQFVLDFFTVSGNTRVTQKVKDFYIFPTALSEAELITLTGAT
jgi:hypothetical protein